MEMYLGCPIWSFKGWVGNFYPTGTQPSQYLREYARRLTTIEGNTTFYAVPGATTIEHWSQETPETFRFCPKIPKTISHSGKLAEHIEAAHAFVEVIGGLGGRLGPMFLQLPPRYSPLLLEDLGAFLNAWPRAIRLAVEVRHLQWFDGAHDEALNRLLSEHHMARVIIDTRPIRSLAGDKLLAGSVYQTLLEARRRKPNVPVIPKRTADFVFLRYIGHPKIEINAPYLAEWADYIASQPRGSSDAYVFCHSPDNVTAPVLCREFHASVAQQVPVAPLPWDAIDQDEVGQPRLL